MIKKLATLAATAAILAAAAIPVIATSGNDCTNDTTGPFSTNYCDITNSSNVTVNNVNDLNVVNYVDAYSGTGNNSASYNTLGGSVHSGNASTNVTLNTVGNINTTNVSVGGDGGGNTGTNFITGPFSGNRITLNNSTDVYVENSNTAQVYNRVDAWSETGNNSADFNTGPGSVVSGNADTWVGVNTHVNDNLNDIWVGAGGGGNTAVNDTTGPFSTNYIDIFNSSNVSVRNVNDALIANRVSAGSETGFNSASFNTLGGDVDSGDADTGVGINNQANLNTTLVAVALGGFGGQEGTNFWTGPYADDRVNIANYQDVTVDHWNNKCRSHNADSLGYGNERVWGRRT